MRVWFLPVVIGQLSIFGLVTGLLADGWADVFTWSALCGACIVCASVCKKLLWRST